MTHKDLMLCLLAMLAMLATLGCSGRSAPARESAAFGGLEYGGDSYGGCTDDSCSVCGGFWSFDSDPTSDDQTSPPDAGLADAPAGLATVGRVLAAARQQLHTATRDRVLAELGVEPARLSSVLQLLDSQIDLSLQRLFPEPTL
jgi:hypothetical protein